LEEKLETQVSKQSEIKAIEEKEVKEGPESFSREEIKSQAVSVSLPQESIAPVGSGYIQEQYKPQHKPTYQPKRRGIFSFFFRLLILIILLGMVGFLVYLFLVRQDLTETIALKLRQKIFSSPPTLREETPKEEQKPVVEKKEETLLVVPLLTSVITSISPDYDFTKITAVGFDMKGEKVVYCAPLKINLNQISCFLNEEKLFDNPYNFKPYWAGISPDGKRIIFLYYDSINRKSFTFENGQEGKRYDGIATHPEFSPDSKTFVFMIMGNDGKNFMVINDRESDKYDKIFTPPEFSPDGKNILYGARQGEKILWVVDKISLEAE